GHAAVAAAIGGAAEAPVRVSGSGCSDTVIAISHTRRSRPSGRPPPEDSGGAAIPTAECVEFTLWLPSSCSAACGGGSAVIRGRRPRPPAVLRLPLRDASRARYGCRAPVQPLAEEGVRSSAATVRSATTGAVRSATIFGRVLLRRRRGEDCRPGGTRVPSVTR